VKKNNVGIITINGYYNYGNRLQNYALQKTLEDLGNDVETIKLSPTLNNKFVHKLKIKLNYYRGLITKNKKTKSHKIREENFKKFSKEFIKETKKTYYNNYNLLKSEYDFFVIGSDQVWNPYYTKGLPHYFAGFANESQRISYAASFGISNIPKEYKETYDKYLSEIQHLSVREEAGADLIKEITNREAAVHVDPVMLLSKDEWLDISKSAPNNDFPYLLTYFLGGIPDQHRNKVESIAAEKGLKIINLGDANDFVTYETSPSEFIDYVKNCEIFLTDSFHGAVFSIIFKKPFIVYNRVGSQSMYSRIDTLLNKYKLHDRKNENINYNNSVFEIDYNKTDETMIKEKDIALNYLQNALKS